VFAGLKVVIRSLSCFQYKPAKKISVVGVYLKSFFIFNRCVISQNCILWLRSLCLDAHIHRSCSFAHQKRSVFSVASASACLLIMLAGKLTVFGRGVLDVAWGMSCLVPASFPAKTQYFEHPAVGSCSCHLHWQTENRPLLLQWGETSQANTVLFFPMKM